MLEESGSPGARDVCSVEQQDVLEKFHRGTGIVYAMSRVTVPDYQVPPELPPTFLKSASGCAVRPPAGARPFHPI